MNRWISDLHWRRKGQQSRSERTQNALLDAAEELLLEKGTDGTSVADIAERAGCAIGSVYHHFKDKKALLYAVFNRMTETFGDVMQDAIASERWEGANFEDILRGYLEFSLSATRDRPAFKAAALLVASDYPELREHYAELLGQGYKSLFDLLMERANGIGHPDPHTAIGYTIDYLSSLLRTRHDPVMRKVLLVQERDDAFVESALTWAREYLKMKS